MIFLLEMPAIGGSQLLMAVIGIILLVLGVIFFMRNRYRNSASADLAAMHRDRPLKSPLDSRNKYPEVEPLN